MHELISALAQAGHGVFTRKQAVAAGVPPHVLPRLARSGILGRVARGTYCLKGVLPDLAAPWVVTAAHDAVLSYWSAAAWWDVDLLSQLRRVHITVPRNRKLRRDGVRGVRVHRAALTDYDVRIVRGVPVTSPLRTCLDLARHGSLESAVAVIDGFFRRELLSYDEFVVAACAAKGPGRLRMQMVAGLVDPASGSVLESLVRVLLWRNGLRPPTSQHLLVHPGTGWRGYLDFAWPELKVALECDGYEWHCAREPFEKDRRRWSTLSRMRWGAAVVTWFQVTEDPAYVVGLVADLLGQPAPRHVRHTNVFAEADVA